MTVPTAKSVDVVDAWIQPWTKEVVEGLDRRTTHVFERYGASRVSTGIPMATMIAELDASPVDLALISGGPTVAMSLVLEALETWPDRLIGVAAVNPLDGVMRAVRELESYVRSHPICAMKLEPFYYFRDPTDRVFYPLYAKCEELGIALQTQVGGTGPLYPSRSGLPLHIDEVALDFPDLTIVCGHVGTPWVDEMIHVAWKHDNVYIDTSARLPKHFEPSFVKFMASYGQDRCIYASDWPLLDFGRPVEQIGNLGLPDEVRRKFLAGNAIRAFRLDRFGVTQSE
jgi:predicted TIM-barrel fold metal-dependent hydrolase